MILSFALLATTLCAQPLKPGFSRNEYLEMMLISARTVNDSVYASQFDAPRQHTMIYQSPVMALDNLWDLWLKDDSASAVISIRGTTAKAESWLLNFYAAMIPATGQISWGENETFDYTLSDSPQAAVHTGWLVGTAFLSKDILPKIDSLYKKGVKEFVIMGHSQGGGIAYLLASHLYSLQEQGNLPTDIRFKVYCSAAPKPGNLAFAYTYEKRTQNGWAFNVVNASDWVPEVPISIQTLDDFNPTNPFINAENIIDGQKFSQRLAMKYIYNQLDKPTRKAQLNYQKFLGKMTQKMVEKSIPGLRVPDFAASNSYVRTGITVVLSPDEAYRKQFPEVENSVFTHHLHAPYIFLIKRLGAPFYTGNPVATGNWELTHMAGIKTSFEDLYSRSRPTLNFEDMEKLSGSTGCNRYSTTYYLEADQFFINTPVSRTKRGCPEGGEEPFLNTLTLVNRLEFVNQELLLFKDEIELMRFSKME